MPCESSQTQASLLNNIEIQFEEMKDQMNEKKHFDE